MSNSEFVLFKFKDQPADMGRVTWILNPFDVNAINYLEKNEIQLPKEQQESPKKKPVEYRGKILLVQSKNYNYLIMN
jgi:hypothetical protein